MAVKKELPDGKGVDERGRRGLAKVASRDARRKNANIEKSVKVVLKRKETGQSLWKLVRVL